jgi:F-type H+-transporting ATPase subunit epsilon
MKTLAIEVITPEKSVLKETAEFLVIPAAKGPLGVLPGHAPLVGRLFSGHIRIEREGKCYFVAVGSGIFEIRPEQVKIVADSAEMVPDKSFLDATEGR